MEENGVGNGREGRRMGGPDNYYSPFYLSSPCLAACGLSLVFFVSGAVTCSVLDLRNALVDSLHILHIPDCSIALSSQLLHVAVGIPRQNVHWPQPSVCVSVCLSCAAFLHYCTDPSVTLGNGRWYPISVHYWADLHCNRCTGFDTMQHKCLMRNMSKSNCTRCMAVC